MNITLLLNIQGFSGKEKEYIATQGPKDNTLSDFWQMILEQNVTLIVMVGMGALYECDEVYSTKHCHIYSRFICKFRNN